MVRSAPRAPTRAAALDPDTAAAAAASAATAAATTFEPRLDASVVYSQLAVLAVVGGAAAYWWLGVVPSARRTLAKEKRAGPLRAYLEDIQSDEARGLERWFYTDWLRKLARQQDMARRGAARRAAAAAAGSSSGSSNGAADAAAANAAVVATVAAAAEQQPGGQEVPLLEQQQQDKQQQDKQQTQQQQQQAADVYVDREPAFWSLDNPLIATAALIAAFGGAATLLRALQGGG